VPAEPTVETIGGPLPTSALGVTLSHEHVVLLDSEVEVNQLGRWRDRIDEAAIETDLRATKLAGVDTIVDVTAIGQGRNVARVKRLAASSGLNVVVATGIYTFDLMPRFFAVRGPGTPNGGDEPIEAFLVREIEDGIADTGVRAGVIKCCTDAPGITPDIEAILRASARAHRRTGVPITTHTDARTRRGPEQQRLFRSEGVDLSRVVIGHCGDSTDLAYLTEIMDAGSYVGLDRFGYDLVVPVADRVRTIAELVGRGYAGRLLLSHDATCYSDSLEPHVRASQWPNCSHRYLVEVVVPMLFDMGVGQDDVDQMLVRNPAAVLGRGAPY
jgi:phosphotriesterase-related protein